MDAKELRIGNYVEYSNTGLVFQVDAISKTGLEVSNEDEETWIELETFEGIKLTEEWLLKFEFILIETIQGLKHYWLDDTGLFSIRESKYNNKAYDLIVHVRINETVFIMSFDYVHEIQNYFALTNKELNIKQ